MPRDHIYIYLCYGRSPQTPRELRYSLETLLPEIGGDASRVAIFTDRPETFRDLPCRSVDIAGDLAARGYRHAAKPLVLAKALRLFERACVLIDTDSFIRPGFDATVARALAAGAAMNAFVRARAYADFGPFETDLPHLRRYVFDQAQSPMLNSGLVAARPEHAPLLEDAVVLIERLWSGGLTQHDIEQFAIGECLRFGGVPIALIDREFVHYFPRWSKRYMRRRLRARAPGERIPFGKTRVRLFKGRTLARLGWRRLRRQIV
jgi:hypothetical protein